MTTHQFGPVLFRGRVVQAVCTVAAVPPEEGCRGCGKPLVPGEYFYIHETGGVWHGKCHWTAKAKPQRILTPTKTFRVTGWGEGNIKNVDKPKPKTFGLRK